MSKCNREDSITRRPWYTRGRHATKRTIFDLGPPPMSRAKLNLRVRECVNIQGGAEPTDTFQIWILRRRDSLWWLVGRGTVEERTPFHMASRNGSLERATTCYLCLLFRQNRLACPVARPHCTRFFFLWGFLNDRVFRRRIMTIQELKQAVVEEVAAIVEDLRRRVYGNFQTRLHQCIDVNGGHLPDIHKISL